MAISHCHGRAAAYKIVRAIHENGKIFYVAVAIVDCHRRGHGLTGERIDGGAEGLAESGGAFKSGRPKKKSRSRSGERVYACMCSRDTRPLYEQYLMDCIGRAQTLNLTFTIIATLRGDLCGTPQGAAGSARRTAEWDDARR